MDHPSIALVTGAAQGLGRSISFYLANCGWAVATVDRDASVSETAKVIESSGGTALALTLDVTDAQAMSSGYSEIENSLGPVEAVVANAAIVDRITHSERIPPEQWQHELNVNLSGAFFSIQPALSAMKERRSGRIIAISSYTATEGLRGQVAYTTSKAGLLGMVRTLSLELAPFGVTANAVLPGMVETEKVSAMPTEVRDRALERIPFGRFARCEEVAATVAFLASSKAAYVTGAEIPVDGGMHQTNLTLGKDDSADNQRLGGR